MATLSELRTACARDLRDPDMRTFAPESLTDLINAGIDEVGRVLPQEKIVSITPLSDTFDYDVSSENLQTVFRVEHFRSDLFHANVPQSTYDEQHNGFELWAGHIRFPNRYFSMVNVDTDEFRVWGYAGRARLTADDQVAELDDTAEFAVRSYVKAEAFGLMQNDRALYRQWQAQSNNSDVTVNQLTQMTAQYRSEWDRTRNHLRRLRRV